ncbi:MAG: MarR family transcriptional regulator [Eubacteriaceae bacterium]|jgi:Transcriptional regulators|nr:MarR family transcriptional regulator [Eubacteriaceae bacterium]
MVKTGKNNERNMHAVTHGIATYNSLLRTKINDYLKEQLKECGYDDLVPSYGALLSIVYRNGGTVQIKVIYDSLLKQKTTITEMINRLVKLGYLTKSQCTEDKRVTYVSVTERSKAFKSDFDRISRELMNKIYGGFSEKEKQEFVDFMARAIDNFD